jgi:surface polysaccharide O-acyltransferase-like enzyme
MPADSLEPVTADQHIVARTRSRGERGAVPGGGEQVAGTGGRVVWMDQARIAAIVFVVLIHSIAPLVYTRHGSHPWWVGVVLDSSASWAVPVFVMLSGALLLSSGRTESVGDFYRRRFLRVGIPAVFWVAFYYVFATHFRGLPYSPRDYLELVVQGTPYSHLYFLFVILGLYAVTPAVRVLVQNASRQLLWTVTVMALVATWLNQLLLTFTVHGSRPWALTWWLPYVGYFLLGYLLRDVRLPRRAGWLALGGYLVAVAGEALFVYVAQPRIGLSEALWPLSKQSLLTLLMSVSAFVLFRRIGAHGWTVLPARLREAMSDAAFGVYLLHFAVLLFLLDHVAGTRNPTATVRELVVWAGTVVISFAVALVLRRIPFVRAVV